MTHCPRAGYPPEVNDLWRHDAAASVEAVETATEGVRETPHEDVKATPPAALADWERELLGGQE